MLAGLDHRVVVVPVLHLEGRVRDPSRAPDLARREESGIGHAERAGVHRTEMGGVEGVVDLCAALTVVSLGAVTALSNSGRPTPESSADRRWAHRGRSRSTRSDRRRRRGGRSAGPAPNVHRAIRPISAARQPRHWWPWRATHRRVRPFRLSIRASRAAAMITTYAPGCVADISAM